MFFPLVRKSKAARNSVRARTHQQSTPYHADNSPPTQTVHILTVSTPVQYAMAALVALTCLFLAINLAFLVYYRNHKVHKL